MPEPNGTKQLHMFPSVSYYRKYIRKTETKFHPKFHNILAFEICRISYIFAFLAKNP